MIIGIIFFLRLPRDKRANHHYLLPLLILVLTVFYENLGAYSNFNVEFTKNVNAMLGNTKNPRYNVWVYNIFNQQLLTLIILFLLKSYIPLSKKKIISWLMFVLLGTSAILIASGAEPIYGSQPLIFSISASSILISCGLYFMSFMKEDSFLESNPLQLASFWQVTCIFFYFSVVFLKTVSEKYLWEELPELGRSIMYINIILWILILMTMTLPLLNLKFEKEPSHV